MHEALAETHDFGVGLALGVKVGTAFTAAHWQRGQAVFKDLLKAEKLDDRSADCGVETKAALVGTDCGVELNAEAAVDVELTLIVVPGNTKLNKTLWLDKCFNYTAFFVFGFGFNQGLETFQNFLYGLKKLRLMGIPLFDARINVLEIFVCNHGFTPYFSLFCRHRTYTEIS